LTNVPFPADAFAEMFFPRRDGFIKPSFIHARVREPSRAICIVTADRVGVSIKHGATTYSPDGRHAGIAAVLRLWRPSAERQLRPPKAVLICQTPRLSSRDQEMAYLLKNLRKTLPARDRRQLNAEQRSGGVIWCRAARTPIASPIVTISAFISS
jgi:hypothetical protein